MLAKFYVSFGRHQENIEEAGERDDHENVELHRLNVAEINPSLELSWNSLHDAHASGGPRDHHAGSLGAEEHSQTDVETHSVVSSIEDVSRNSPHVRAENEDRETRH